MDVKKKFLLNGTEEHFGLGRQYKFILVLALKLVLSHISDSIDTSCSFYPRWKDYEMMQAQLLNFTLDESQWQRDWTVLLSLASQPG